MSWLTRDEVRQIVKSALDAVANYADNFEEYHISELPEPNKKIMIDEIAAGLKERGYRVSLSITKLNEFDIFRELVDYIDSEQSKIV